VGIFVKDSGVLSFVCVERLLDKSWGEICL